MSFRFNTVSTLVIYAQYVVPFIQWHARTIFSDKGFTNVSQDHTVTLGDALIQDDGVLRSLFCLPKRSEGGVGAQVHMVQLQNELTVA